MLDQVVMWVVEWVVERVVERVLGRVEVCVVVVRGHDVHDCETGPSGHDVSCGGCCGCGCGHVGGHGAGDDHVLDSSGGTVIDFSDYVDCVG